MDEIIIASTYRIIGALGSGGGGNVYLAEHLRMNMQVVLKADKRDLSAKPESLRREVDVLKNLKHTYIPRVYDFFVENGVVYTVMDYIPGESLDKPLKRGERFSQPQVIKWACQILTAVSYLHSVPPHGILHADIKPANIMLTPTGDVSLIDFNIALALGEEGAAIVGRSPGYASPEHYGLDFRIYPDSETTMLLNPNEQNDSTRTVKLNTVSSSSSGYASGRRVLLDKRSDIYSLGATRYHLFTGRKPEINADQINDDRMVKLTSDDVSPLIAAIINKAMNPNPDLRYQSADEMLEAFTNLHENDPRSKRLKKRNALAAVIAGIMLLAGGSCIFGGMQMQNAEAAQARKEAEKSEAEALEAKRQAEEAETAERKAKEEAQKAEEAERLQKEKEQQEKEKAQRAETALKLINEADSLIDSGSVKTAAGKAVEALELHTVYDAAAQTALTKALGVYDVFDGYQAHGTVELSSEALKLCLSPDGSRLAALSSGFFEIFDTETGALIGKLEALNSALSDIVFLDNSRVVYASPDGLYTYDIETDTVLWKGFKATSIALSADRNRVAAVFKDESEAYVYDTATGNILRKIDFSGRTQSIVMVDTFADPEDNLFAINADGRWLAVSFANGSIALYDTDDAASTGENDVELFAEGSSYKRFEGGFCGDYYAFSAYDGADASIAVCMDMRDFGIAVSFPESTSAYKVRANEYGIWVANGATVNYIDFEHNKMTEAAFTSSPVVSYEAGSFGVAAALADGRICIFDKYANLTDELPDMGRQAYLSGEGGVLALGRLDSDSVRILKTSDHPETKLAEYDGNYAHSETRLHTDGNSFMQFDYRSFRICDLDGKVLTESDIPDNTKVYDQQYRHAESISTNVLVNTRSDTEHDGIDRLEVYYYDGTLRVYSAKDGSLVSETKGEKPDESLTDEFLTDKWRIVSSLHGSPQVYDAVTGELKQDLEEDAYLTYVTQSGDNTVIQYMNSDKKQYGLLLNANGDVIAQMPYLCDILEDNTLVFDDMKGTLRKSHIYSLEELLSIRE